ncbi:MAG TPA: ferritin family protein [bacterium]|nr:ferritin family protein [bacterium]
MSESERQKAIDRALEFETGGKNYYEKAMRKAGNPASVKLFEMMVKEEQSHVEYLEEIKSKIDLTDSWPVEVKLEQHVDFAMIFEDAVKDIDDAVGVAADEINILSHAMELEKKGVEMYRELSEKAEDGAEKAFYAGLSAWEQEHYELIEQYFDYYQDHGMFTEE